MGKIKDPNKSIHNVIHLLYEGFKKMLLEKKSSSRKGLRITGYSCDKELN